MRLRSIALRGLTTYRGAQPVVVDFDALGPGLIAVCGPNGAGKSTLLEAVPLALYRTAPSRPGLYDAAHGRDAFVEAAFDDCGDELKVRLQIDADNRKAEQYVFLNGNTLTTGRAKEAEEVIAQRFGSYQLLVASVFASQGKAGSFLTLSKVDRKALFVELLGLKHLELLQEDAKKHRGDAERAADQARALVERGEGIAAQLPVAEKALEAAQHDVEAAAGRLATAQQEEAAAVAALERARGAGEQIAALERAAETAARQLTAARGGVERVDKAKRTVVDRHDAALRGLSRPETADGIRLRAERTAQGLRARRADLDRIVAERPKVDAASTRVLELVKEREAIESAAARAQELELEARSAVRDHEAAVRALEAAEANHKAEMERLLRQTELLQQVPCTDSKEWIPRPTPGEGAKAPVDVSGACPLLAEARAALRKAEDLRRHDPAEEARRALTTAKSRADRLAAQAAEARSQVGGHRLASLRDEEPQARTAAARREVIEEAVRQLAGLDVDEATLQEQLQADLQAAAGDAARVTAERERLEQQHTDDLLELSEERSEALALHAAAESGNTAAVAALADARQRMEAATVAQAEAGLRTARGEREQAERHLRGADAQQVTIATRVDALREEIADLAAHQDALRHHQQEVGDWALLERALGRDGVQALEIDAAGPEVARLTNELLQACYGARFSIAFETLREKKSARGEFSESFDVRVFDGGEERPVEALSGGEKVVVGEALGLAIAIANARKSGVTWKTLFRDETAGALDADNAAAYVDMLRRALALGGFDQVLFVSHSAEVMERADVRLLVRDGRVRVDGAPEPAARLAEAVA